MPIRLTLAVLLAAATQAAPAAAAEWRSVGRTFSGNEVFVDAAATRQLGDIRTTWIRIVYVRPLELEGRAAHSTEALAHFDWLERRGRGDLLRQRRAPAQACRRGDGDVSH